MRGKTACQEPLISQEFPCHVNWKEQDCIVWKAAMLTIYHQNCQQDCVFVSILILAIIILVYYKILCF